MENLSKDFKFKKQFGQNFIFDKNFLTASVRDLNLDKDSCILEIGPGAGTLTEVLAQNFKKVISIEIDKTLQDTLINLEKKYENLHFIFKDVLKIKTEEIDNLFDTNFFVVANLPYYITSQIVFKFLLESKKLNSMFVMVQKEVGERFCAKHSTKEYGIPSVLIGACGECKILKQVSRKMFVPMPNVDSCILQIKIDKSKYSGLDYNKFGDFVASCFKMRRKMLVNNLLAIGIKKEKMNEIFDKLKLELDIRPENLTCEEFVNLYKQLIEHN